MSPHRRLFHASALFLLSGLVLATPCRAGTWLVTTDASFSISEPPGTTALDFEVVYNTSDFSSLTLVSGPLGASISSAGKTIEVDFPATSAATFEWTFITTTPPPLKAESFSLSGLSSSDGLVATTRVSVSAIPEPPSVALAGIASGMWVGVWWLRRIRRRARRLMGR